MEFVSKTPEETEKIALDFAQKISLEDDFGVGAKVVGLYGDLGAGKTTFMKGVAKCFGIIETVQSPTFVIEKVYEIQPAGEKLSGTKFKHLIHIDAYRIEKEDELTKLGWDEIMADSNNIIFVEWPERILGIMPEHEKIIFDHLNQNEQSRKITTQ